MKPPIGITVLALLNLLCGGGGTLYAVLFFWWPPVLLLLPFTLFILFLGIGLWRLRKWARIAQVICAALSIVSLVSLLVGFREGALPLLLVIGFYSWVFWYMFQPNVKQAFKAKQEFKDHHFDTAGSVSA